MAATLDKAVPWGRSFDEYVRMFDLSDSDLHSRILDCAGGPASFNVEMRRRGRIVVSCDPIYQFSAASTKLLKPSSGKPPSPAIISSGPK